ncbi:distal tail protein Dit [Streptococcus acidominimus]|uniref:Phage tail protein n=1 Tax=Streptococcus acidominimus TaxID=1326 RepID=A0A4Y9FPQ7_STRAI|nr:distal tail protein Dit [Streptococcus acidominimus]MBF0819133.1 phage tail family protein [Streptococcus acidominimus]MBF0838677.1 phage tail family protein [Streptococcus acidominimus]MBF0846830.1 phage tail family protein [Streptococcus danieliae]TFU30289.1 phage tail protein [Streptococcus acidominimus]
MSIVRINFNGVDLSEFIEIHDIRRDIGNSREATLYHAPAIGANLQQVKTQEKYISVEFSIWSSDRNTLKHQLAGILNVDGPKRLFFTDEPDKYYLALPIDDIIMRESNQKRSFGKMRFLIPDGVAHSITYRKFENGTVHSDKIVFNLTNDGNVPAFPIITVKNNAENGYIGLVNTSGALEVGDREEADKEVVRRSEALFDYRDSRITTGLSAAAKNVAILNDGEQSLVGRIGTFNIWGRLHLCLENRGSTVGNGAGSITWNIPADSSGAVGSLNDYIWWRQVFWLGAVNQYGFIKLTVSDDQGRFLYGVETYKRRHGLDCEYNFFTTNNKGGYNMVKRWNFHGAHENHHNPFNEPRGWSDLKRNDDRVTVYWFGSYYTFTVPEIRGRKSAKIHVTLGALGDKPLVTRMYLDSIMYRKDFVPVTRDIPNRYPIGSNVVLNSENDTITVDGLERIVDVVHGSTFLTIPPGKSTLEVYSSSWVRTKPTVKVEFEERYL